MRLSKQDIAWAGTVVYEIEPRMSYADAAAQLSQQYGETISRDQLRSALRRHYVPVQNVPPSMPPRPLTLTSDVLLVMADLHVPYHSAPLVDMALRMLQRHGGGEVVIIGDLGNFDAVSQHPKNAEVVDLETELDTIGRFLSKLSHHATGLTISNGNHDERLARKLDARFSLERLIHAALHEYPLACDLRVTEYDYVLYRETWAFGHLSAFSRRPGEVARKIADRYRRNVAVGHDHIQGFTTTFDGKYLALSIGCMAHVDQYGYSKFWYKERRFTDYPPIQNGFLILDHGVPYLYNATGLSVLNGSIPWSDLR